MEGDDLEELDLETFENVEGVEDPAETFVGDPLDVFYCGGAACPPLPPHLPLCAEFACRAAACGLPPEYCEWGPKYQVCRAWLEEHAPHLVDKAGAPLPPPRASSWRA